MRLRRSPVLAMVLFVSACAAPAVDSVDPGPTPSLGGKADDFFSPSAFEYVVEGRLRVTLEARFASATRAEKDARLHQLIGMKHIAMAYFLTQYLIEKEPRERGAGWGGMGGMAKAGDYREMDIVNVEGLTYEYTFQHVVAAKADLLRDLPLGEGGVGDDELALTIGNPTNEELAELETDHEWFRRAPWEGWDPARVTDAALRQDIALSFRRETASHDAWLDYPAMFDDGKLTIDVHFGYDYHSQYHRKHARALYLWLRDEMGFHAPITNFDQLVPTTAPFTSTLDANGREIAVEVRIFYGKDGGVNDPSTDAGGRRLDADFRSSFASSDVVIFAGHAGPFYGFSLANWKETDEGDLSYLEIESLQMAGRYQLFIADGCDTYQTAAGFARNPMTEGGTNLDVITTTSYGDAELPYSVMNTISHLVEADPDGLHRPRTIESLLIDLRDANWGNPMYGIHFIDDNPTLHPYADTDFSCEPCTYHTQCGAPGNRCVSASAAGTGYCAAACTTNDACPRGYTCGRIATNANAIYELGCVPSDASCE